MTPGGGAQAVLPFDAVLLIAGLISFVCLFLTWAVVEVDSIFVSVSNDISGLDFMDDTSSDLRYYPFVIAVLGILMTIFAIVRMISGTKYLGYLELIFEFLIVVITVGFIIQIPLSESIAGIVTLEHNVSVGYAPVIVLICNILGLMFSVTAVIAGGSRYLGSIGKRGYVASLITSAGLMIDYENRIVKDGKTYGIITETNVRIYDKDLTHNMVPFEDVMAINEKDGVVTLEYKAAKNKKPLDVASKDHGNGVYVISGRGRLATE